MELSVLLPDSGFGLNFHTDQISFLCNDFEYAAVKFFYTTFICFHERNDCENKQKRRTSSTKNKAFRMFYLAEFIFVISSIISRLILLFFFRQQNNDHCSSQVLKFKKLFKKQIFKNRAVCEKKFYKFLARFILQCQVDLLLVDYLWVRIYCLFYQLFQSAKRHITDTTVSVARFLLMVM